MDRAARRPRVAPNRDARRVHVLCAPPNGYNPGMTSVDRAFADVAAEAGLEHMTYWRLWDQSEWKAPVGGSVGIGDGEFHDTNSGLTYRSVRGRLDEFLSADAVVYWGDFLHMAVYQRHTIDVLTRRMGALDPASAESTVARTLMLRGQPDHVLDRVLSFGTTLTFNSPADYAGTYGVDLEAFARGVNRFWLRDPYSATVVETLRAPREDTCKGIDAAFLQKARPSGAREEVLGVFLGRSTLVPEAVARFGRRLAHDLNLAPEWIPWGTEPAFWPMHERRRLRLAWPGLEHRTGHPSLPQRLATIAGSLRGSRWGEAPGAMGSLLARLSSCSVVLTDTYHLAVNAWRLGTPAVCITDAPGHTWSVNSGEPGNPRDKRTDLYSQIEALGLLVDASSLRSEPRREVARVIGHLRDHEALEVTGRRIDRMSMHARSMFTGALLGQLGPARSAGRSPETDLEDHR